jgi:hypothetical protein
MLAASSQDAPRADRAPTTPIQGVRSLGGKRPSQ